jgi:glycine hydroxymethyltransferase
MNQNLKTDQELHSLIDKEFLRQKHSIELIASENYTSIAVRECLGSCLTNKYSEGYPGKRYYGGNNIIDKIENLAIQRSLDAFRLDKDVWGVNVQAYSGSVANVAAYLGIINKGDRIMGLDLPSGGHLTHGFQSKKGKRISHTSLIFESIPYRVKSNGYIDYENLSIVSMMVRPKLIICGASAYSRDYDYKKFREIADKCGALLLCDMSHFNGFVATQLHNNPFDYCDVVTTTTHKTLRGPRAAVIFCKKKYINKINQSVFPGLQGGPHNHQIAAIAYQMKEIQTDSFKKYMIQVRENSRKLASIMMDKYNFNIITGGTDNHLLLIDLRNKKITGHQMEKICEYVNISLNKNCVPEDISPLKPSGIRIGTSAMTTRGMNEKHCEIIAYILNELCNIIMKDRDNKIENIIIKYKHQLDLIKQHVIDITATLDYYN